MIDIELGKYTKEHCKNVALKYNYRKQFSTNDSMVSLKFIWTKEKCQEESLKYNTKRELQKNNASCYNKILKMKWFDELCSHMNKNKSK